MKKNKYNVAFLILHFLSIDDTRNAVASIKKMLKTDSPVDYEIVVVDNGSHNHSGETLRKEYLKDENVKVIINERNMGFAAGNNVGFRYIKRHYDADFIIMMNNDIVFIQDDFMEKLIDEYNKSYFDLLGPKIVLPPGIKTYHRRYLASANQYRFEILKLRLKWMLNFIDKKELARQLKHDMVKKFHKEDRQESNMETIEQRLENVIVHGSCMIFSRNYIQRFDGLEERTFLYGEEDLLYIRLILNDMKIVYNPDMVVFHNEDASTNAITDHSVRKKNMFVSKYGIKARKEILKDLKKIRKGKYRNKWESSEDD